MAGDSSVLLKSMRISIFWSILNWGQIVLLHLVEHQKRNLRTRVRKLFLMSEKPKKKYWY